MSKLNTLDRRQFLKGAAMAGAALGFPTIIPSSALGADGAVAPSNRIVMGFIGMGGQGQSDMRDFLSNGGAQVVAVCDVDADNLKAGKQIVDTHFRNKDCRTYKDFRDLLATEKLDAVGIMVPDHWHALIAIAAAKAGLDIFGEKPLARSIREARAIVTAVQRYGRVWQTGSWQRSRNEFYSACMLARNGRIGKIQYVEVGLPSGSPSGGIPSGPCPPGLDFDFWLGPAPAVPYRPLEMNDRNGNNRRVHWNWRWIMDYSGGQLTDWAGHHIDIAHWGMDKDATGPVEIAGKGVYPGSGIYNTPIRYDFTCKYADGLTIRVGDQSTIATGMGVKFFGENGQWIYCTRGQVDANPKSLLREVFGPEEVHLEHSKDHTQNFLDCVKTRNLTITPAEVACRSISVGLLGEIAMLTGRTIKWDPDKEEIQGDPGASELLGRSYREPWKLQI